LARIRLYADLRLPHGVVVEPSVTLEQSASVLAEGTESEAVDFKREYDASRRHDVVVLAKEIGAMQVLNAGGYVSSVSTMTERPPAY
jgi:hypothetical protein